MEGARRAARKTGGAWEEMVLVLQYYCQKTTANCGAFNPIRCQRYFVFIILKSKPFIGLGTPLALCQKNLNRQNCAKSKVSLFIVTFFLRFFKALFMT